MDRLEKIKKWHYDHGAQIEEWLERLSESEISELHTKHASEIDVIAAHCDLHNSICDFIEIREKYNDSNGGGIFGDGKKQETRPLSR